MGDRVGIGAEFPVFFPVTRELHSETSSLETASSSGESANHRQKRKKVPFIRPIEKLPVWPPPEPVRQYGKALLDSLLLAEDESLQEAIKLVLNDAGALHFWLDADAWEVQTWEALYQNDFLSFNPDIRIARVVDPYESSPNLVVPLEMPLRLMAVLSAVDIEALPQWEAICDAAKNFIASADDDGFRIHLRILAAEEAVLRAAEEERDRLPRDTRLTIDSFPIRNGEAALRDAVTEFGAHILHFFCHGEVKAGASALRIANANQYSKGETFPLTLKTLSHVAKEARVDGWLWLVVLSACKSAQEKTAAAAERTYSLTQDIVKYGVPAGVGMAEEIDPIDAQTFCQSLYPAVFKEIARAKKSLDARPGGNIELDLAKLMHGPRTAMRDARGKPCENRQWTLPVLYLQRAGFRIHLGKPPVNAAREAIGAGLSIILPPSTPSDIASELQSSAVGQ